MKSLSSSCVAGYETLAAWADLLDRINVFPVADGDTGMNLRISLAPFQNCESDMVTAVAQLATSGRGNSGNIAVSFLKEMLKPDGRWLGEKVCAGRDLAWKSIAKPCPGTMLGIFDALCLLLGESQERELEFFKIRKILQKVVLATEQQLPALAEAGVVDSGALGMFIFFDGFFQKLINGKDGVTPVMELFSGKLRIASSFHPQPTGEYCVEAMLATVGRQSSVIDTIAKLGESAVIQEGASGVKLHLHTRNPRQLREELSSLGKVVNWSDEAMDPMAQTVGSGKFSDNSIRIMSDAAGSIPLDLAKNHGIIVLDSYILTENQATPESYFHSNELYSLMKQGVRLSTAQASNHERHLHYQAACEQHGNVVYISTGSAFTGNFQTAMNWKKENDSSDRFEVVDSGAASGRLAVIVILAARLAAQGEERETVIAYAKELTTTVEEYIFIHELKYLVAGGRISKTKGFFADLLHLKPVISPGFSGARKVGTVKDQATQLDFALGKLNCFDKGDSKLLVLLQYSDNKKWLQETVEPIITSKEPNAEILLVPLSLTSGVHMGPGTWSIALGLKKERHA